MESFLLSNSDTRDRQRVIRDEKRGLKEKKILRKEKNEIVHGNFYQLPMIPTQIGMQRCLLQRYADYMEFGIAQNRRFYSRMKAF